MDLLGTGIDALLRIYFGLFSWGPPVIGLSVIAALAGAGMLWIVGKTSNQKRIKQVKRAVAASLLELRVFDDEPTATGRALKSLFAANLRYMGLALQPALWMAIPMALLLIHLESFYGRAPLPTGREALVTMRMAPGWNADAGAPQLTAPTQVEVTSPPVRVADAREVSWRLLPKSAVSGELVFQIDGQPVSKRIEAGDPQRFTPERRVSSSLATLWSPGERTIPVSTVEWVEIRYPGASLPVLGMDVNWLLWFFLISVVSALLLKKRFGVVI
jgi:hypothetical protein